MSAQSRYQLLALGFGLILLAGCTPSSQMGRGGQSFPLVNPSFMALPVQPMLCDTAKVGYCRGEKPAS
jgi:hypothetical protein